MISTTDFKNGIAIKLDGQLWTIVEFQHVKPGKGSAFVRTRLRRFRDGSVIERTFRSGEKFEEAFVESRSLQFLYTSGDTLHLMDGSTYEQLEIPASVMGDKLGFLKENMELQAQFYENNLISLEPPMFIEAAVTNTEPGVKGDSSKAGMKPATLETGATVRVPLFVENGDVIKVDTRTGTYVSRV
jgi:elongation factor P